MLKFFIVLLLSFSVYGQQYKLIGKVYDSKNGDILSFANIRIEGTNKGTSANRNGEFNLLLNKGKYKIITSFIGYNSDTLSMELNKNTEVKISLNRVSLKLDEVTVKPGINPAIPIIEKAIKRKNERNEIIESYVYHAYSKGVIKSDKDISTMGSQSVSVGIDSENIENDSLFINAIFENQSKGYFKMPDQLKEEIIAQKQTANIPSTFNFVTGSRLVQNFYNDDVRFFDKEITGPLDNDALDYYYFYLVDSMGIDNNKVYKIKIEPETESDPGFIGDIYILDKTYDLLKVDVNLNDAAILVGVIDDVHIFQQLVPFNKGIYMPVDYRMKIEGSFMGLIKFDFTINSIMNNYDINEKIDDDFFDYTLIKVLPGADKKEADYWNTIQSIPQTDEEIKKYSEIDSLESMPKSFWDEYDYTSDYIGIGDNYYISNLIDMYYFNKVEGHGLNFSAGFFDLADKRWNTYSNVSYGLDDEKFKYSLYTRYKFGDYRTSTLYANIFDNTGIVFSESKNLGNTLSSLYTLFTHSDFYNYYYQKGWEVGGDSWVLPYLKLEGYFKHSIDKSAVTNSEYSFFNTDDKYEPNFPVIESTVSKFNVGFEMDFRNYIEDGYKRIRAQEILSHIIINGGFGISENDFVKSDYSFKEYYAQVHGRLNLFSNTFIKYNVKGIYQEGNIPYQHLAYLPTSMDYLDYDDTFRTLRNGDAFGDRVAMAFINYQIGDLLFRKSGIPLLKESKLDLGIHINAAYVDITNNAVLPVGPETMVFKSPFYEAGFSLGHPMLPLTFGFTWKLNYRGKDNFNLGITTILFN